MTRISQLDAVRGIAVLLVLVHNTDIYPSLHLGLIAKNGWMGVDLFFVLSGFLITGILISTKDSAGYCRKFYARRCLRIWPLYYSALLFMFVVVPVLRRSEVQDIFGSRSGPWWAYPLFVQNYLVRVPLEAMGLLGVTWSLGVEEQFYLVWPLVVRFCGEARLRHIALAVICISPILRLYLSHRGILIYSNPVCRLDGLMAGSLLALMTRSKGFSPSRYLALAWVTLLVMAPLAVIIDNFNARWIVFSLVAFASLSFVYLALFTQQRQLQALLRSRVLVYTGTISYGIYLLSKLPVDAVKLTHLEKFPLLAFSITIVVTYALAALSWKILESPFLRLKRSFDSPGTAESRAPDEIAKAM